MRQYTYDANDRLTQTTYADGTSVSYTYDVADRLISINDTAPGAGLHSFTYDIMDRLIQETNARGTVKYAYDAQGRRTSLTVNSSRTLNYSYDVADQLTGIQEGSAVFTFAHDVLGRRVGMTMPNGVKAGYTYDSAGRMTELVYSKDNTVLRDLQYSFDELDRQTSYSGNPVLAPAETEVSSVSVNSLNQYTNLNGQTSTYDNNGNQKQIPSSSAIFIAQWNARDQLTALSGPNQTASFTYDAFGRRSTKTINGQSTTFLYDGSDIVNETGSTNANYTHGPAVDEPLARYATAGEYYLSDALGSVVGLTDSAGSVKTAYNYSAFGKTSVAGSSSENAYKFTGREDEWSVLLQSQILQSRAKAFCRGRSSEPSWR
jgi:YD repeat-containing protein